jgi:hypothetical protein
VAGHVVPVSDHSNQQYKWPPISVDDDNSTNNKMFPLIDIVRWNFSASVLVCPPEKNIKKGRITMDDSTVYRRYAEECKRLAWAMSAADQKVMIEIADAWLACAKEAEQKELGRSWPTRTGDVA